MREIKFRVWDNHYKYMNYKVIVGIYGEWEKVKYDKNYTACSMWIEPEKVDYKCEPHWTCFEPYHEDIKLMQYTDLKDRNGVEIYEGDIVKAIKRTDDYENYQNFKVHFHNGCFMFGNYNSHEFFDKFSHKEVIGNIYDNPELLEED